MTAPDYKDVTSGLMGGVAGKFSPDFYNQSWTTQKNLVYCKVQYLDLLSILFW